MRIAQQLIVVAALAFATLAVGVNVYASTRGADQRAQQLAVEIPVASVLDRGVVDTPPGNHPSRDSEGQADPCVLPDDCPDLRADDDGKAHPENHGQIVSAYAKYIGWDHAAGPPGLLVREIARPADDKQPPGLDKDDDKQPPGLDKDDKQPPGKNKDG
ncbi:MAG: hypothetical protein U9R51_10615 [Actinomycetota bacterium]|nr:hypothetical protein [Actinomycetota bacterium]